MLLLCWRIRKKKKEAKDDDDTEANFSINDTMYVVKDNEESKEKEIDK